jgi:putrescine transport system substrate-binding protein
VVNFYNWFDYIGPDTLPEFTRDTGIKVNYDVYDSDETFEGKLLAGNTGYDLVVATSTRFARQHAAGLYRALDWNRLPNARELDPYLMEKLGEVDPGNRFGVPHSWGTTGIAYNADRILERMPDAPLDSWALIFDPEVVGRFRDCGVALLDAPGDVVQSALVYLGRDPATEDRDDLRDAIALIAQIRPFIRYFHSSQVFDDLANGEICLAIGWSGSVSLALHSSAGLKLKYVIPKEGSQLWFEVMASPADASHVENAYRLIDHLLTPRIAADFTNTTYYPNAVASALQAVDASIRTEPAVYPSPADRRRLLTLPPETTEYERARLRLWMAMKSG